MQTSQSPNLRFWRRAAIAAGPLFLCYFLLSLHQRSFSRLAGLLGFDLPPGIELTNHTGEFPIGDSSQAWLIHFPAGTSRPWESSGKFSECLPRPDPAEDYLYIRSIVHGEFPHAVDFFQCPRVWRGGHEGNCYIASSDDGTAVIFYYFTT